MYVLQDKNGQAVYEELRSEGSINLIGSDKDCTGMNDTSLSEQYYARGKGLPKPVSTSTSLTATTSATTISATASTTPTASPSRAAAPQNGANKSSAIHQVSLKSTFLVGMVLAPLIELLV